MKTKQITLTVTLRRKADLDDMAQAMALHLMETFNDDESIKSVSWKGPLKK